MTQEDEDFLATPLSKDVDDIPDNPYVSNPYHGNILPGTAAGLKLYLAATNPVEESKQISLSTKNCLEIKTFLKQAGSNFGWD